ncbi:Chromatin modification-related protein eaf3, partial [Ceratocystis fimbriata CBS 114723]|uniref:Chromatin modification-related protein EAF3 n=2 Tax=Ceratocystis TaxID=5157 RepID=A0A0F8B2G7_CERFI
MAPSRHAVPPFVKDERVLCFHHEMLYEAKVLDVQKAASIDGWKFKVHYKGWKNTWDDWVTSDRMRKFTDENKELASQLAIQAKSLSLKNSSGAGSLNGGGSASGGAGGSGTGGSGGQKAGGGMGGSKKSAGRAESSVRGSEERGTAGGSGNAAHGQHLHPYTHLSGGAGGAGSSHSSRGPRRARDYDLEQEDAFHARPAIQLPIADHIKALLVDDWENVTKNNMLVPTPHAYPVATILDDYLQAEKKLRTPESANWDILHEVVAGVREYFEKALGKILLYRFERPQYHDMLQLWESGSEKYTGPCDTYGPEHLARLLVSLPELVAQTNMDQQSVSRLREELSKFSVWLARNAQTYFAQDYESPSQEYVDQAKLGHM